MDGQYRLTRWELILHPQFRTIHRRVEVLNAEPAWLLVGDDRDTLYTSVSDSQTAAGSPSL